MGVTSSVGRSACSIHVSCTISQYVDVEWNTAVVECVNVISEILEPLVSHMIIRVGP